MDTKQIPTFDQDLTTIVAQLPPPVQKFFASGKVEAVAKSLMQKNKLHIDQGAVMEREIILLLLGLKSPDEFTKTLSEEAKLDKPTISGIVQDVNAQIFVPLRDEMRKGPSAAASAPPRSVPTPSRPPQVGGSPTSTNVPLPRPTVTQPVRQTAQGQVRQLADEPLKEVRPPQIQGVPRSGAPSARPDLRSVLDSVTRPSPKATDGTAREVPREGRQTSLNPASSLQRPASRLLEDHEEPHIEFHKPVTPPANLPGMMQPPKIPEVRPSPTPPAGGPKVEPQIPQPKPIVPAAPYSSDPYREPIDEK